MRFFLVCALFVSFLSADYNDIRKEVCMLMSYGNIVSAEDLFAREIKNDPCDPELYLERAMLHLRCNYTWQVFIDLENLNGIELGQDDARKALLIEALATAKVGNEEEAIGLWTLYLTLYPFTLDFYESPETYVLLHEPEFLYFKTIMDITKELCWQGDIPLIEEET